MLNISLEKQKEYGGGGGGGYSIFNLFNYIE